MCSKMNHWSRKPTWSEELLRRLRRSLGTHETYRQHMSQQGHNKRPNWNAETPKWEKNSLKMRRATNYTGLRGKMHLGRLKIRHAEGHTLPVKQHPEYLAVKIVKVGAPSGRKNRRLSGMASGQIRVGTHRGNGKKDKSTIASSQKLECLWWSVKGGYQSGRWNHPHRTKRSSLVAHDFSSWMNSNLLVDSFAFVFSPKKFRSLHCACAAQTFLILCDRRCAIGSRIATTVLEKESRRVSIPHSHTAHITHSVFFGSYRRHFSQVMSPINLLMRNGQATPISLGGNLTRSMMNSSLPALPSIPSDQFNDVMEPTDPPTM